MTHADLIGNMGLVGNVLTLRMFRPDARRRLMTNDPVVFANCNLTDAATRFTTEVNSVGEVTTTGKYHVDRTTGVVNVHADSDPGGDDKAYKMTWTIRTA